ncbi:MAG TPA: putative sugar nucleotidyl transferase [Gemmataceae bacterium]|nr:putative sugar nucleotidyl transferase [Gemmataceae bacterium]
MRICIFEDRRVDALEPLSLTRPAFDLLCGAGSLLQRHVRAFAADEVGVLVRPELAELCRLMHPELAVNDPDWLRDGTTLLVNARWLPSAPIEDRQSPRIGLVGEAVAYVVLPAPGVPECTAETVAEWVEDCKDTLPRTPAGGVMAGHLWDLVEHNPTALDDDLAAFRAPRPPRTLTNVAVLGPEESFVVDPMATIEPFVVADTRNGPVLIDRGAVVHSFSRLEGPCYVGPESWILGAKLRGGTIGPCCRIGGEVEACILQGHSNKYHDGFLGHSYVGEWVNLGAGTQVSDLRNDYGMIRVSVNGVRVPTGRNKVGSFIGDHTKTGLGTLLNTGTTVGAFCGLLPSGSLLPHVIPSFCMYGYGQLQERWDLRQLFATAAVAMRRRGHELSGVHTDFLFGLYDRTAALRRKVIREVELRRWRQSV